MDRDSDFKYEEETFSDSFVERHKQQRKPHKGGKIIRENPTSVRELQACSLAVSFFRHQACFEFCELVERIQFHHELARLFVAHLHNNEVTLARVTFTISPAVISEATRIPNVGEKWYKVQDLDEDYCELYIKSHYRNQVKRFFPFKFLENRYVPLMRIIIKYFTCEGKFSRLYAYHIRLLMHFTRVKMMNLPYFLFRNIDKIAYIVQKKPYPHQLNNIYHYSLIKIIVLHHLSLLNIPWENFIAHEMFKGPQIP